MQQLLYIHPSISSALVMFTGMSVDALCTFSGDLHYIRTKINEATKFLEEMKCKMDSPHILETITVFLFLFSGI